MERVVPPTWRRVERRRLTVRFARARSPFGWRTPPRAGSSLSCDSDLGFQLLARARSPSGWHSPSLTSCILPDVIVVRCHSVAGCAATRTCSDRGYTVRWDRGGAEERLVVCLVGCRQEGCVLGRHRRIKGSNRPRGEKTRSSILDRGGHRGAGVQ